MKDRQITELFTCQCSSAEHIMIAQYWPDDKKGDVYLSIHLTTGNFFERLKNGIKYIFGHRSKYGDFDEIILKSEDWEKAQKLADYLKP